MIIVFGSMNMDLVFPVGHAPAAGETIVIPDYQQFPGGKGANQAVAAVSMGASVTMAACVGDDAFGGYLINVLKSHDVDTACIDVQANARTGSAIITLEQDGENRIMVAAGANAHARQDIIPNTMFKKGNTVLMQMETSVPEIKACAQRAQGRVDRVILNLAPMISPGDEILRAIDYLILNEIEIVQLAKVIGLATTIDYTEAAIVIARTYNLICILTLGRAGAEAYSAEGLMAQAKALPLEHVVDSTGAGDAFSGALAAFLDEGRSLQEAMQLSCIAGSLACLKMGAMNSYPARDEVLSQLTKAA